MDYLICDEAQFYTVAQVEQMARLVDVLGVDVFAFGLATDFRTELFPASQRLFELADEVARLQVEVLCWCGGKGHLQRPGRRRGVAARASRWSSATPHRGRPARPATRCSAGAITDGR